MATGRPRQVPPGTCKMFRELMRTMNVEKLTKMLIEHQILQEVMDDDGHKNHKSDRLPPDMGGRSESRPRRSTFELKGPKL